MEMRRNNNLSPQSYWLNSTCSMIPEPLVWLHICAIQQNQGEGHCALSHSAGGRGSRMELWSHTLRPWVISLHRHMALTRLKRTYLFFSKKIDQVALKSWLHLGCMSCQISTWKFAWITTGNEHEAADITNDWWWLMWQLSRCYWWRCCHGAAWSRDSDLMPKKGTGRQTQHLDAYLLSPRMNPDCCAHQEKEKDDAEEELSERGLWRKNRFLCPK